MADFCSRAGRVRPVDLINRRGSQRPLGQWLQQSLRLERTTLSAGRRPRAAVNVHATARCTMVKSRRQAAQTICTLEAIRQPPPPMRQRLCHRVARLSPGICRGRSRLAHRLSPNQPMNLMLCAMLLNERFSLVGSSSKCTSTTSAASFGRSCACGGVRSSSQCRFLQGIGKSSRAALKAARPI
jgi:hypothetical protein